jgi:hypothetical protein
LSFRIISGASRTATSAIALSGTDRPSSVTTGKADAEEVVALQIGLLRAVAREQSNDIRELLVEAEPNTRADGILSSIVGSKPHAVGAFRQRERRQRVTDFTQGIQGVRQVRGFIVALLEAELETKPGLRVELGCHPCAVARQAQHLIVHERVADELRRSGRQIPRRAGRAFPAPTTRRSTPDP